jgi:hypothetical protein
MELDMGKAAFDNAGPFGMATNPAKVMCPYEFINIRKHCFFGQATANFAGAWRHLFLYIVFLEVCDAQTNKSIDRRLLKMQIMATGAPYIAVPS